MARLSSKSSVNDAASSSGATSSQVKTESKPEEVSDDEAVADAQDQSLHPDGQRSLSFISIQAFALGNVFTAGFLSNFWLVHHGYSIWRLPAFLMFLSLFHFLEFYMTARYNTPATRASSFLLFNNGTAYTLAHTIASVEIILANLLYPPYLRLPSVWINVPIGLVLVIIGQIFRSRAMAQAGTNFNHIIARERRESHVLITNGIYGIVRHPSYFGFFWWAVGTQILVGNKISLLGYVIVLWRFFKARIAAEERFLVKFFDQEYIDFKKRIPTGIPYIE